MNVARPIGLLVLVILLLTSNLLAQTTAEKQLVIAPELPCGATLSLEQVQSVGLFYGQKPLGIGVRKRIRATDKASGAAAIPTPIYCIPVTVHVIQHPNRLVIDEQIHQAITLLNQQYQQAGLAFYVRYVNYKISNMYCNLQKNTNATTVVNYLGADWSANSINLIVCSSVKNEAGNLIAGFADFPFSSLPLAQHRIVVNNAALMNGSTLPHEFGHFLNLLHTHETAAGAELVSGPTCTTVGDFICDTPADPAPSLTLVSGPASCLPQTTTPLVNGFGLTQCLYTGSDASRQYVVGTCTYRLTAPATDAQGELYNPMINNLMSYYQTCRTQFTEEQMARTRQAYEFYYLPLYGTSASLPILAVTPGGSTVTCNNVGSVTLRASTHYGGAYQWLLNSTAISGATSYTYLATQTGTYTLQATVGGCSVSSSAVIITDCSTITYCSGPTPVKPDGGFNKNTCNLICNPEFWTTLPLTAPNHMVTATGVGGQFIQTFNHPNPPGFNLPGWVCGTTGTPEWIDDSGVVDVSNNRPCAGVSAARSVHPGSGLLFFAGALESGATPVAVTSGGYFYAVHHYGFGNSLSQLRTSVGSSAGSRLLLDAPAFYSSSVFWNRSGSYVNVASAFNTLWLGTTSSNAHCIFVDHPELIRDTFTAGPDRTATCSQTMTLGGQEFCMLSNVRVNYIWTNQTTGATVLAYSTQKNWDGSLQILNGAGLPVPAIPTVAISLNQTTIFRLSRQFQVNTDGLQVAQFSNAPAFDEFTVIIAPPALEVVASATTVSAGQSVTLTATGCPAGGVVSWSTGQLGERIVVAPTTTTQYSLTCTAGTCQSIQALIIACQAVVPCQPRFPQRAGTIATKEQGEGVAVDALGNVFVLGIVAAFNNHGQTPTYLNAPADGDRFLAKYDRRGCLKWVRYLTIGNRFINLVIDGASNVYAQGNVAVHKFTTAGMLVSSYQPAAETIYSITVDLSGVVYVGADTGTLPTGRYVKKLTMNTPDALLVWTKVVGYLPERVQVNLAGTYLVLGGQVNNNLVRFEVLGALSGAAPVSTGAPIDVAGGKLVFEVKIGEATQEVAVLYTTYATTVVYHLSKFSLVTPTVFTASLSSAMLGGAFGRYERMCIADGYIVAAGESRVNLYKLSTLTGGTALPISASIRAIHAVSLANIFITGGYTSTLSLAPAGTLAPIGDLDVFTIKLKRQLATFVFEP